MNKLGSKILLVMGGLIAVSLLLIALARFLAPSELMYSGKPLSYWVDQLGQFGLDAREARLAIRAIGPPCIPGVFQAVRRQHSWSHTLYARIWEKLSGAFQRRASHPALRYDLARIGAALGTLRRPAVSGVVEGLKDEDSDVRVVAELALFALGPNAREAVGPLLSLVRDPSAKVRFYAVCALGRMGSSRKQAITVLIGALSDPGSNQSETFLGDVRQQAARVLGEIGPEAKAAVPALTALFSATDASLRVEAILAAWHVGRDTNLVSLLIPELKRTGSGETCRRIITAFGEMGRAAKPAISAMVDKVANPPFESVPPTRSIREVAMDAVDQIDQSQWSRLLPDSERNKRFFDDIEKPPVQFRKPSGTVRARLPRPAEGSPETDRTE